MRGIAGEISVTRKLHGEPAWFSIRLEQYSIVYPLWDKGSGSIRVNKRLVRLPHESFYDLFRTLSYLFDSEMNFCPGSGSAGDGDLAGIVAGRNGVGGGEVSFPVFTVDADSPANQR